MTNDAHRAPGPAAAASRSPAAREVFVAIGGGDREGLRWASVPAFAATHGGIDPASLPRSVRLILEATLRGCAQGRIRFEEALAVLNWQPGRAGRDTWRIPIGRVLMQDAAGLPLLADLAALRDTVAGRGGRPETIQPQVPLALVIDHSVEVNESGTAQALEHNLAEELRRNAERYAFVKWAAGAFNQLEVVPPGNGIVHHIHMERLVEVVSDRDGWWFADSVVGTDSHTTMINGLGVLGWGVGGIEAEAVLLGDAFSFSVPEIVAVHLTGRMAPAVAAADVALALTRRLRAERVTGAFLEFVGSGIDHLSAADRCTIANMAPEYGATLALFPVDETVLEYLRRHRRDEALVARIRDHLGRQGLFGRQVGEEARYDRVIHFDLSNVGAVVAGPSRPDQLVRLEDLPASFGAQLSPAEPRRPLDGRIVLAAIASCTNTANPRAMVTAGLLAKRAAECGLTVDPTIKTSLTPGSRSVTGYLAALGLIQPLERLGFHVAAYGCGACVGNSGGLAPAIATALASDGGQAVAVVSGNRNFEARIHSSLRACYLASPALVLAFALAGRIDFDFASTALGTDAAGRAVSLSDLWPSADTVEAALARLDLSRNGAWYEPEGWRALPQMEGTCFPWAPGSTYFVRPIFFERETGSPLTGLRGARPLLVLGDAVTTDHISPVGPIAKDSPAGRYLAAAGVGLRDLNTYAARRTNHEVMRRGTFANPRLRNRLLGDTEGPYTRHLPSGEVGTVVEIASRYADEGVASVIVAGDRYGAGSARDWAAKGTALLGVRAVIARGFERIHRGNLVRLGVLAIEMTDEADLAGFLAGANDARIDIRLRRDGVRPHAPCTVRARADGRELTAAARLCIETEMEIAYLQAGDLFKYYANNQA